MFHEITRLAWMFVESADKLSDHLPLGSAFRYSVQQASAEVNFIARHGELYC